MPMRNVVITEHQASLVEQREAEDACHLEALCSAVQVGIADIEAGRFKTFDSKQSLQTHLKSVTAKAIAGA
jgi:antitoxin ParD1/3/4